MNPAQYNSLQPQYWFGWVDSRPLSLFRIGYAALLLKNALYFIPLAHLFYSDEGIVPRLDFGGNPALVGLGSFSILNFVATSWMASLVFCAWAVIALSLLLGFLTRTMTVLNFLFWLSLLHRNPYALHAPDHVLMVLGFWMIFLPLNHCYAIDRWLARRRSLARGNALPPARLAYAFPLRAIQIQVAIIYLFTSYYKWQGLFWRTGEALFYTFQQESFLLPAGAWLGATAPLWLIRLLTWSTLLIEASFVVLVFFPVWQPWAKAIGLCLAALLHLGIAVTMAIPDLSLAMWISYLLFLEPAWIDWLERRVRGWLRMAPAPRVVDQAHGGRPHRPAALGRGALALLLTLVLIATIWGGLAPENNIWNRAGKKPPPVLQAINRQLNLASPWTMFAYHSLPRQGWLRIAGQFGNDTSQLLYSGADPSSGRIYRQWGPAARLRFFEQRLIWSFPEPILRAWGDYYCRLYNGPQAQQAASRLAIVEISRRYRWTRAPTAAPSQYEEDLLWRQTCRQR